MFYIYFVFRWGDIGGESESEDFQNSNMLIYTKIPYGLFKWGAAIFSPKTRKKNFGFLFRHFAKKTTLTKK